MERTGLTQKTILDYDEASDVLYINFRRPQVADDSDLTDEGIIVRMRQGKIVGLTIPNAKKRIQLKS